MESMTPLYYEFFRQRNLIELPRIMATNYTSNWQALPFAQKYYGFARQLFVKKICAAGHWSCLALTYINNIKKFCKSYNDGEKNLEDIIDSEFLKYIDPDFMIIEDDDG